MTSRERFVASRHAIIAALFLACAVALGGGGTPNPGTEVLLQLVFVVAALAWLWIPAREGSVPVPRSAGFWILCVLVLVLPLVQLVPLPPSIWTTLAGHEDRAAALALVGRESSWQPLTHSAPRTLAALLAMVPPLFAFFAAASLGARGRLWLAGAIVVMALVTALLGAVQVSMGPSSAPYLYAQNSPNLTSTRSSLFAREKAGPRPSGRNWSAGPVTAPDPSCREPRRTRSLARASLAPRARLRRHRRWRGRC